MLTVSIFSMFRERNAKREQVERLYNPSNNRPIRGTGVQIPTSLQRDPKARDVKEEKQLMDKLTILNDHLKSLLRDTYQSKKDQEYLGIYIPPKRK